MDGVSTEIKRACLQRQIVTCARNRVGITRYEFFSENCKLPETANCYMFVWWVMTSCDVVFSNTLLGQVVSGVEVFGRKTWQSADVVFTKGLNGQVYDCLAGHVGIFTGDTVIHACSKQRYVVEEPFRYFLSKHKLVVVRRVI